MQRRTFVKAAVIGGIIAALGGIGYYFTSSQQQPPVVDRTQLREAKITFPSSSEVEFLALSAAEDNLSCDIWDDTNTKVVFEPLVMGQPKRIPILPNYESYSMRSGKSTDLSFKPGLQLSNLHYTGDPFGIELVLSNPAKQQYPYQIVFSGETVKSGTATPLGTTAEGKRFYVPIDTLDKDIDYTLYFGDYLQDDIYAGVGFLRSALGRRR